MCRQGDKVMEKAPLGNNLRPRQSLNNRAVRTNIAVQRDRAGKAVPTCSDQAQCYNIRV